MEALYDNARQALEINALSTSNRPDTYLISLNYFASAIRNRGKGYLDDEEIFKRMELLLTHLN